MPETRALKRRFYYAGLLVQLSLAARRTAQARLGDCRAGTGTSLSGYRALAASLRQAPPLANVTVTSLRRAPAAEGRPGARRAAAGPAAAVVPHHWHIIMGAGMRDSEPVGAATGPVDGGRAGDVAAARARGARMCAAVDEDGCWPSQSVGAAPPMSKSAGARRRRPRSAITAVLTRQPARADVILRQGEVGGRWRPSCRRRVSGDGIGPPRYVTRRRGRSPPCPSPPARPPVRRAIDGEVGGLRSPVLRARPRRARPSCQSRSLQRQGSTRTISSSEHHSALEYCLSEVDGNALEGGREVGREGRVEDGR